jgi:hypothetical protein
MKLIGAPVNIGLDRSRSRGLISDHTLIIV